MAQTSEKDHIRDHPVSWLGEDGVERGPEKFYRRRAAVVVVALGVDGRLVPISTGVGLPGFGGNVLTDRVQVRLIGTAGNVSPAWPVLPGVPTTSTWRVRSCIYNAAGIIGAPGVSLVDAGDGAFLGPSSGATVATTGKVDLTPRSPLSVGFGVTFAVTGGAAGDTYDIILERET